MSDIINGSYSTSQAVIYDDVEPAPSDYSIGKKGWKCHETTQSESSKVKLSKGGLVRRKAAAFWGAHLPKERTVLLFRGYLHLPTAKVCISFWHAQGKYSSSKRPAKTQPSSASREHSAYETHFN